MVPAFQFWKIRSWRLKAKWTGIYDKHGPYIIKVHVDENPRNTIQNIAQEFDIAPTTLFRHWKNIGYVNRYDVWVLYNLTEQHWVFVCDLFLNRNAEELFQKNLLLAMKRGSSTIMCTDDDYGLYRKVRHKRRQKRVYPKKILLSIWWNWKGVIHFELLLPNQTMNLDRYWVDK